MGFGMDAMDAVGLCKECGGLVNWGSWNMDRLRASHAVKDWTRRGLSAYTTPHSRAVMLPRGHKQGCGSAPKPKQDFVDLDFLAEMASQCCGVEEI